jgi:hypothetical protein
MNQPDLNNTRIVKDIRTLADSITRLWTRRHRDITCGVAGDAQHFEDFAALHRVVTWTLNHPWTCGVRLSQVATRLQAALRDLSPQQEAEIRLQLRIAALTVTVRLRQQPDGSWLQLPMKDAA